jgi:hypothetical protein
MCGQALIDENHAHLVALGVSHPALETIRAKTADPFKFSTKLTGAGGGGCAVTLLPDGAPFLPHPFESAGWLTVPADVDNATLSMLTAALSELGFVPYLTAVGGSGLGVLPPSRAHPGAAESADAFTKSSAPALAEWAEARGRWLYV